MPIVACAVLQIAGVSVCSADESPLPTADYGVSTIWQLGGIGGWDYLALEPSGARLFVSRGDRVDVVETSSGRRAGIIPNTAGVHGIAFAPELKRGYTSNGRAATVTAFERFPPRHSRVAGSGQKAGCHPIRTTASTRVHCQRRHQ
jgi:hypothetical protein